jgi:hypothetical protein
MIQWCETVKIILEYFLYTAPCTRNRNTAAQYEVRKPMPSQIMYPCAHAPSRFTFLSPGARYWLTHKPFFRVVTDSDSITNHSLAWLHMVTQKPFYRVVIHGESFTKHSFAWLQIVTHSQTILSRVYRWWLTNHSFAWLQIVRHSQTILPRSYR